LINQLLDTRKVDKGQMVLRFCEIDIAEFIKDIGTYFDFQVKAKKIQMNYDFEAEKMMAWVDPKNFDKIIFNLLSNAMKYTPECGRIDISLHSGEDNTVTSPLHHYFEIVVSNTGNTIDEKEMTRIFERFYQIQNAQSNANIGSGIGLHLTRSLVLLHHGTIRVCNNEDNNGCRFIIRIPFGKAHLKPEEIVDVSLKTEITKEEEESIALENVVNPPTEETHAKPKSKYKILVVEDDDEIRNYICDELSAYFYMQKCTNGKEALALILKKAPDLVISDIMMPEMDGITLCRKIKQNVNINSLPVILLTAKTREQDNMEGLSVGADAYITKPFNVDILIKTADNLIHNREVLRNLYSGSQEQVEKLPSYELQSSDSKLLDRIMNVINHNLSNSEVNVEMIAKEVGLSRVHLYRKLKELTNQSPRDFIRNVRLRQAATLLASKQYNVSEVTSLTGFSDVAVFSRAFKELYGETPTAYANENYKSDVSDKDIITESK
jgi:DNA-binding response OmpR family regulator